MTNAHYIKYWSNIQLDPNWMKRSREKLSGNMGISSIGSCLKPLTSISVYTIYVFHCVASLKHVQLSTVTSLFVEFCSTNSTQNMHMQSDILRWWMCHLFSFRENVFRSKIDVNFNCTQAQAMGLTKSFPFQVYGKTYIVLYC